MRCRTMKQRKPAPGRALKGLGFVLGTVLSFVAPPAAFAQPEPSAGARQLALGGAGTALRGQPWDVANPATLDGLDRPRFSMAVAGASVERREPFSAGGGVESQTFNDRWVRPSFLGLAWPLGRATVAAHLAERDYDHRDRGIFESFSTTGGRRLRLQEVALTAAVRPTRWLSLGGRLGRERLSIDASTIFPITVGRQGVPSVFEWEQDASDAQTSVGLGVILSSERFSAAFAWSRGIDSFVLPYTRSESFPTLSLVFTGVGEDVHWIPGQWRAGATWRPQRRLLLAGDYVNNGPFASWGITQPCVVFSPPAPTDYCRPLGPFSLPYGRAGEDLRAGGEFELKGGATPLFLRGGFSHTWLDLKSETWGGLGLGVVFRGRLHADVGARFSANATQVILSVSYALR